MSYVRNKPRQLEFDDPEMAANLEVIARPMPIGLLVDITSLMDGTGKITGKELIGKLDPLLREFSSRLVSWTLEDEDAEGVRRPVPATYDGLKSQDMDFGMELLMAWMNTVAGVSAPLDRSSSAGPPSLEASLPMVALSPNP